MKSAGDFVNIQIKSNHITIAIYIQSLHGLSIITFELPYSLTAMATETVDASEKFLF